MAKKEQQWLIIVFAVKALVYSVIACFLLTGPFILSLGYMDRQASLKAVSWPRAIGRISQCEMHTYHSHGRWSYRADIQFEYWVGPSRYVSSTARAGVLYKYVQHSEELALELVKNYPAGKEVRPAYDPASPNKAILEPGIYTEDRVLRNVGIGFTLLSVFAILYNLYDRRRDNRAGVTKGDPDEVIWRPGRLAFIRGFSSMVKSPDDIYTASFGTRSVKNASGQPEIAYECSVEWEQKKGSLVLFSTMVPQNQALPELRSRPDVVVWSSDSTVVEFRVTKDPIIVRVNDIIVGLRHRKTK